jgi:hypothetical protein
MFIVVARVARARRSPTSRVRWKSRSALFIAEPPGAVCGLVRWRQLEDRVPRCWIVECFYWRSLGDREEAVRLAGEAVKIGFEDRWTRTGGKLAHGIVVTAHRAGRAPLRLSRGYYAPSWIAAGGDQVTPAIEVKRVHRYRDCPATLSATHFENVEVPVDRANPRREKQACNRRGAR